MLQQDKTTLRAFVDATPTPDLLKIFAECGIRVRICNAILSTESTPQHLVYRPSFTVSFGFEGREMLQYIDEPDLNQALTNGILWMTKNAVSNTVPTFIRAKMKWQESINKQ